MNFRSLLGFGIIFFYSLQTIGSDPSAEKSPSGPKPADLGFMYLDQPARDRITWGFIAGVPLIVTIYGSTVWEWGDTGGRFGTGTEGWFERDTYTGGADKIGHMHSMYIQKRLSSFLFENLGHDSGRANWLGVLTASLVGIGFEIGDGFSKYNASGNDLIVDGLGITFAYVLDKHPHLDEKIGLVWQYWPSKEYLAPNNPDKKDIMSDYNGMKFAFQIRANGFSALQDYWYLRFLNLDLGYYTRGFAPDIPPANDQPTFRHVYAGVSLNLWRLLDRSAESPGIAKTMGRVFKYWQLPPTALELVR